MESWTKTVALLIPIILAGISLLRTGEFVSAHFNVTGLWSLPWSRSAPFGSAAYDCTQKYSIELLSIDPLIIYINDFLKSEEIDYLRDLRTQDFEHSYVYDEHLESVVDADYRSSKSIMVSRNDIVATCLRQRMKSLLGNVQHISMEPPQIVKYEGGEKFRFHMDWFDAPLNKTYDPRMPHRPYNRLASIFAYLDDNCTGGETYFPDVTGVSRVADGNKFSVTESGKGLLVKPRTGNAVFWNNLYANGTGDPRVKHAGMPVKSGRKMGMNLFGYYFFDAPMVGGSE